MVISGNSRRKFLKLMSIASIFSSTFSVLGNWSRKAIAQVAGQNMPRHVNISTTRVVQLTGDYDPEGLAHFNNTGAWGVEGVDLGATTQHDDKLFIFFGDVPLQGGHAYPPHDADLIAYIENIDIPLGANLTAAKQLDDQLDVFFIGNDGALYAAWVIKDGIWQGPVGISPINVAPAGASLAAAKQLDNQLDVFFIGNSGALYVSSVVGDGKWQGPLEISPINMAPAGASLAAAKQLDNQLDVFFIGNNGALYVSSVVGNGKWQGLLEISPINMAPAGASLAAAKQLDNQLDVFFIGNNGALYVSSVVGNGKWQGPLEISPINMAPAGASLAAAKQLDNQLDVFFIGNDGALYVSSVVGNGKWQSPVLSIPAPFRLTPVLKDGRFYPFSSKKDNQTRLLLTNETPTGAFSYDGKAFVFMVTGQNKPVSSLTSSLDPRQPNPYTWLFDLSKSESQESGRFYQIAPCVVKNADIPGLPVAEGDGLILFGHGWSPSGFGVHLAWMPLYPGQEPRRSEVQFYAGNSISTWSAKEADAKTLFQTRFAWTTLSVGRIPELGHWILLNQKAGSIQDNKRENTWNEPIVARIAPTPWDIFLAEEIPIFDPIREGAHGRYMAATPTTFPPSWKPNITHPSFAYGAFLLNPYTTWEAEQSVVTITYLMSTGCPYQVQVMKSRILLKN
jgi:hypothetical protein